MIKEIKEWLLWYYDMARWKLGIAPSPMMMYFTRFHKQLAQGKSK